MNKTQIVVTVAAIAVVGYLYSLPPVKSATETAVKKGTGTVAQSQPDRGAANITIETVSASSKKIIDATLSAKITGLEAQLKTAVSDADKLSVQKQLASEWDNVNQPAPAAFYYQQIARKENTAESWIAAGNHFNDAYKTSEDTLAQPVFDAAALQAFQNATKLAPDNLDAKTGLGVAYVNGGGPPMQGIALLLGVVAQDPHNRNALLNLGLFAMKSGQFDKAVERFKTMVTDKPEVEPYFYLAESYKQLGQKNEAIAAYEKCKDMMPDPAFDQKIDQYIKELKN